MNVKIYARISSDPEGTALGVERQREDCLALVERNGWTVDPAHVIVENDRGASTRSRKSRPLFEQLMAEVESGAVDVVVSYSNSRLTRRPMEWERLIEASERTGTRFMTVVSGDDDLSKAEGRMVARIKASIDAAEAEKLSERVRRQKRQREAQGMDASGGIRPFGYTPDRLHVVDAEADAIRQAADRILAGESLTDITRSWNAKGTPATVSGSKWTVSTLASILRSPRNVALKPNGKGMIPAAWPAILDRSVWESMQQRLASPVSSAKHHRTHLLSGLLFCGPCHTKLVSTGDRYRCNKAPGKTGGGCGKVGRSANSLEYHVITEWVEHMTEITGSPMLSFTKEYEVKDTREKREEIERRIVKMRDQYAAGILTDDDFIPVVVKLRERLAELEAEAVPQNVPTINGRPIESMSGSADWLTAFNMLETVADQRDMLRRYVDRITVHPVKVRGSKRFDPTSVEIEWRR